MNKYEKLLTKAERENLCIIEKEFKSRAKGLIKNKKIGIRKDISTTAEKACVLAEELGHYFTSTGDIIDQITAVNRKQEKRARNWAYEKLLPLSSFIKAYEAGVRNRYELAQFFDITEEFLSESLAHYQEKYGICTCYNEKYIIYFDPLGVYKIFE